MNDTNYPDLDLNLLSVFDALEHERSVTRAAQRLGMTQSALSHALKRLREYFEDPLYIKAGGSMAPTPKAIELAPAILEAIQTIRDHVVPVAAFDPTSARRLITLCMTDMGELVFLPPLIKRLRELAPHCRLRTLQVSSDQLASLLASREADLALGSIRSASEELYKQQFFMHSFVTVVSKRNPELTGELSVRQFESLPHIVVSLTGTMNTAYDSEIEAMGIQRNAYLITPHFLSVPFLINQQPDLIATVPRELANVFAGHNDLTIIEPPVRLPDFALNQYWHPRFHRDVWVVWLRGLVRETFKNYPDTA